MDKIDLLRTQMPKRAQLLTIWHAWFIFVYTVSFQHAHHPGWSTVGGDPDGYRLVYGLVTFYFSVWHWVINLFLLFCRHLCLYKAHNKFFHCGRHQRHQRHHYQIIDQKYILWMERKTKLNWSAFLWLLPFLNLVHSQTPCQEWFSVKNRNCIKVLI